MNKSRQIDSPAKALLRTLLRLTIYLNVIFNSGKQQRPSVPYVFYGGARAGNVGGPLVKIKRLKEFSLSGASVSILFTLCQIHPT